MIILQCAIPEDNFESITNLVNLEGISLQEVYRHNGDIDFNFIDNFINNLMRLPKLKALGLMGVGLTALPQSIGQLKNLEYLDLLNNDLTTLPASLEQIPPLKFIELTGNEYFEVESLPESLKKLLV